MIGIYIDIYMYKVIDRVSLLPSLKLSSLSPPPKMFSGDPLVPQPLTPELLCVRPRSPSQSTGVTATAAAGQKSVNPTP